MLGKVGAPQIRTTASDAPAETPAESKLASRASGDALVGTGTGAPVVLPVRAEPPSIASLAALRAGHVPQAAPLVAPATPSRAERNAQTVRNFFAAYSKADPHAMEGLLAAKTTYQDPVFPHLEDAMVSRMWNTVASGKTPVNAQVQSVTATDASAGVDWVANYKFLGADIHNHIHSELSFDASGKIASQTDTFDWKAWANQTPFPANLLLRTGLGHSLVQMFLASQIEP